MKEIVDKVQDPESSKLQKDVRKLWSKQMEYKEELEDDMNLLDTKDTESLPSLLNNDDSTPMPHEQWKELLSQEHPQVLNEINDEDHILDIMKIILNMLYRKEYVTRHFVSNITTYKEKEYVDHLEVVNLFLFNH